MVKTGSNQFGSIFSVWLGLARFLLGFFGSVRFFQFYVYKTKTEPADFFKILIGFFSQLFFF